MKRVYVLIFCVWGIGNSALSQPNKILPVTNVIQRGDKLCWAACMEMIFKYHNRGNTPNNQCVLARIMSGQTCPCNVQDCTSRSPDNCNNTANLTDIQGLLTQFRYNYWHSTIPNWDTIKNQISKKRPLIAFIRSPIQTGCESDHVVVVIGYRTTLKNVKTQKKVKTEEDKHFYLVYDPYVPSVTTSCAKPRYKQLIFSETPYIKTICSYLDNMFPQQVASNAGNSTMPNVPWTGEIVKDKTEAQLNTLGQNYEVTYTTNLEIQNSQNHYITKEITYVGGVSPRTRTTMQKIEGEDKWTPVEIAKTAELASYRILLNKRLFILSNQQNKIIERIRVTPYKKLVLLPSQEIFYYFVQKEEIFFVQIIDSKDIQNALTLDDMKIRYKLDDNFIKVIMNEK